MEELFKFLNQDKDCIKINRGLLNFLSIEEAALYSYLVKICNENYKKEEFKYFDDIIYYFIPVEEIEKKLKFTPFKQRALLGKLEKENLLKIKFGHARKRYIAISDIEILLEKMIYNTNLYKLKKEFISFLSDKFSSLDDKEAEANKNFLLNYMLLEKRKILNEIIKTK